MENINVNNSECIVKREHLTSTEYVNVCSGETVNVARSTLEMGGVVLIAIVLVVLVIGIIYFFREVMMG